MCFLILYLCVNQKMSLLSSYLIFLSVFLKDADEYTSQPTLLNNYANL